jgi:hypothetical protein
MNYQSFQFTVEEYSEELTAQTHRTLDWMLNNGFIDDEAWELLTSTLVVTTIANKKGFGRRILERFFSNKDPDGKTFVFPIVQLEGWYANRIDTSPKPNRSKPDLEVVKNINQTKEIK